MESRFRSRSITCISGPIRDGAGGPIVKPAGPIEIESWAMTDFWKKKRRLYDLTHTGLPPSPLDATHIVRTYSPLNGRKNEFSFDFQGVAPSIVPSTPGPADIPAGKDRGDNAYALTLLRRSNPMGPDYSVPVSIKELAELAGLFRLARKSLYDYFGGNYLNYRFGWSTFYLDVVKLANLADAVMLRFERLRRLAENGGIRANIVLDNYTKTTSASRSTIQSAWNAVIDARLHKTTHTRVWGSVRWVPRGGNINILPKDPPRLFKLAVQQALDLEGIDPLTLWELVPFSWLADYFTSVGDYLAANEGRVIVQPTDLCIMRKTTTSAIYTRRYDGVSSDKIKGGDIKSYRYDLRRSVLGDTIPSFPPIFTNLLSVGEYKVVLALLAKFAGKGGH